MNKHHLPAVNSFVILVSGPPASGKTRLATELAKILTLPLFSRDAVKETLFDSLGCGDRDWSLKLGAASYDLLFAVATAMLNSGKSCILEANFTASAGAAIECLAVGHEAEIIQIFCTASPQTLYERFCARAASGERHRGHGDERNIAEARLRLHSFPAAPLAVASELLVVDTSDFAALDYAAIARWARERFDMQEARQGRPCVDDVIQATFNAGERRK